MLARRFFPSAVYALILAIGLGVTSLALAREPLTWPADALFGRDIDREDIRQVLSHALEKAGMRARFEAGVEGRVSQNFTNTPPQGVFNMVIENFDLDYSHDAAAGIVTIFPSRTGTAAKAQAETPPSAALAVAAVAKGTENAKPVIRLAAIDQKPQDVAIGTTTKAPAAKIAAPATERRAGIGALEWKKVTFERTSFEEDIRDVFRAIARANGMQVLFRPDVEGQISFEFQDMDLRAAFRKLIAENSLAFDYDADSNTVTLFKAVSVQRREQLIALQYISAERLRAAARRLDLRGEIIVDETNDIVLVKGAVSDVARLADLAEKLDRQEAEKQKQIAADRALEAQELQADAKRQEAQAKQRAAQSDASERRVTALQRQQELNAKAEEVAFRRELRDRIINTQVRVIPVRYASVGPTSQSFRGKQITIPGIDETLRSLLGIGDKDSQVTGGGEKRNALVSEVRAELGLTPPQISIDTRTNSIIVRGSKRAVDQVEDLVKRLDKQLPLIEIEVIIVNAAKGVSAELGVKYGSEGAFAGNGKNYGFGVNTGVQGTLTNARNAIDTKVSAVTREVDNSTTTLTPVETDVTVDPLSPLTLLPSASDATVASLVFRGGTLALQAELRALSKDNKLQGTSKNRPFVGG